jgi:hypothetical protein
MAQSATPAPRGTRALVSAILEALDRIPEVNRRAAFKHATAAVKEKLIAQAEKAKAASRKAPAQPGAKRAAAVSATRRAAAAERTTQRGGAERTTQRGAAVRTTQRGAAPAPKRRRVISGTNPDADASGTPELDADIAGSVR